MSKIVKDSKVIDRVKVVYLEGGKKEYHLPTSMSGESFMKWKERNKDKI